MKALPPGSGSPQLNLWDKQGRLLWDNATAKTPAYAHISSWTYAVIRYPDGSRWSGQLYRCPEGIKRRLCYDDLQKMIVWPNPWLENSC